jgi:hypothetical protein
MTTTALSKIQYVAFALISEAGLFTAEDMAHLEYCEIELNQAGDENTLIADVGIYFDNWSYIDHKKSSHAADAMPAEVRVVFSQDENRKLNGKIECGFFADNPVLVKEIEYIRGW